jgi:hypothetical protein
LDTAVKKRDANDVVREGKPLDPYSRRPITLEVSGDSRCPGLELDRTESGLIRATQRSVVTLLSEHERWRSAIGFDLRSEVTFLLRKPPYYWSDDDAFPGHSQTKIIRRSARG